MWSTLEFEVVFHVHWINHQYQADVEEFNTEEAAREFIQKERVNIIALYRAELIEVYP